jgi:hypothetical protein
VKKSKPTPARMPVPQFRVAQAFLPVLIMERLFHGFSYSWPRLGDVREWIYPQTLMTLCLDRMPEHDLDKLLAYMRSLKEPHAERAMPMLTAQSSLAKEWLTPEEDAAWASL